MALNKTTYINTELKWAEKQLKTWKTYVDANPLHELSDRMQNKETKSGGVITMVVATVEAQGKFLQETMKNYLALLEVVDKLREKEAEKKIAVRGDQDLGGMAEEFLNKRK